MKLEIVLCVDDSEADQFLNKVAIADFDPDIIIMQAYSGEQAIEMLSFLDQPPDVIFLDINMPGMNGLDFLEEYTKGKSTLTKIIILSSSDLKRDKENSTKHDLVHSYFIKPLNEGHLKLLEAL